MSRAMTGNRFLSSLIVDVCPTSVAGIDYYEALLTQCLDALPVKINLSNADGAIAHFNRASYEYHGPRIAWSGLSYERNGLFHDDDIDVARSAQTKALRSGLSVQIELRAIRFDYLPRWHACMFTPLFNKAQSVSGVLVTMSDIHDQRTAPRSGGFNVTED